MSTASLDQDRLARLMAQAASGDRRAFSALYESTSAALFGVCSRMLRDRADAEEVLQETYTTVWRRAGSFDLARSRPMTWLISLARNKAIDRLRQHRESVLTDPISLEDLADEQAGPAAGAEASQEYRRLQECLDELEPQQRRSVREAFFTGATYNELAGRCKVPLGTMKSWIRRSLLQLRTCLDA